MTYLQSPKDKPGDRQSYQQRIASIQRASSSAEPDNDTSAEQSRPDLLEQRNNARRTGSVVRTLYRWFIRFALIAMLILLATLVLFIWSPSSHPGDAAVEIRPELRMTAKNAHQIALPVALNWAEDAQLISLSATWEAGQKFERGEGDWSLLYYSPSRASTASISVHDGQPKMITAHGVSHAIESQQGKSWHIDSETAVDLLKSVGGDEFLRAQPDATVSMSLDFARDNAWRVRFIDQMSRRIFSAQVDIEDGQITDIQQSD